MYTTLPIKLIAAVGCAVLWKYGGAAGQAIVIGVFAYFLIP